MAEHKAELLRSLAIDRGGNGGDAPRPARRRWPGFLAAGAAAAVAVLAEFGPEILGLGRIDRAASQQAAAPSAPAPAPVTEQRAGSLAASGYVVARRKATIAAEITGKVVEVLVEEGMVVQPGQVVARLDSVLAEKDLALAQSRADAAEASIAMTVADLDDATRILSRTKSLSQKNFASEADLTKAEARVGVLTAQL